MDSFRFRNYDPIMKILLIDDEPDVLDLLQLLISLEFSDAVILTAANGAEGLVHLKENPDLDMVFCDFNMPKMNGGAFYVETRKLYPQLNYILVSSEDPEKHEEFKNAKYFHHIDKPFSDKIIYNKILQISSGAVETVKSLEYVPVELDLLLRLGRISCALYLKISSDKFVKVIHSGSEFTAADMERFKQKNVDELYLERFEFENFIRDFKKNVFSKMAWEKAKTQEKIDLLSNDMSLVQKASKIFGWSPQVIQLAQENISAVINVLKTDSAFDKLTELLKNKRNQRLTSHTLVLSIMLTDLVRRLGWESNKTTEKLTFAALLHDLTLDEDLFADKQTLLMADDYSALKSTAEGNILLNHPINAAQLTLNWPLCPPDVDVIIRQHHEKPDGQGFPLELPAFKISPLSALFIMSEDLIYANFINPDVNLKEYLIGRKDYYAREPFKVIYPKMLEMLSGQ